MKTINEEIADLRKRLDELEKQQSKGGVFVPELKQEYEYIDDCGEVVWTCEGGDSMRLEIGNIYKTGTAERVVLNRKIHRFLQEQTDFVADWENDEQDKYCFQWDYEYEDWITESVTIYRQPSTVYFRSHAELHKAAQAAIAKFGLEAFESYLKGSIV